MSSSTQPILYSVDFGGCRRMGSLTPGDLAALFREALEHAGAHVVEAVSHLYPGDGLTAVLVLSESHAVLHTWPETLTANIDIFSCSRSLDGQAAIAELSRRLGAETVAIQEIPRADGHRAELEPRGV